MVVIEMGKKKIDFNKIGLKEINGGITAAEGYMAAGLACGIKKSGKKDLALIYSESSAVGAAVFTTNHFKAAPVLLSIDKLKSNLIRAILVNSGNANSCTGEQGMKDVEDLTRFLAEKLNIDDQEVHSSSTGVIGELLPMENMKDGISKIVSKLSKNGSKDAAEAILTTDTVRKEIGYSFALPSDGSKVKIGGMVKGSGMIQPNMATMLAFISSDISITKSLLEKALKEVVDISFNRISVDGDQSTNDSVFLLANGKAGNVKISEENKDYYAFLEVLRKIVMLQAKSIVLDGEGATRFITIQVNGASNEEEAVHICSKIANSNLVKTACFGGDPNWGRILASLGSCSNIIFDNNKVTVAINNQILFKQGKSVEIEKERLIMLMGNRNILIEINLNKGSEKAEFWTSDLSYDYIKINAEYHT